MHVLTFIFCRCCLLLQLNHYNSALSSLLLTMHAGTASNATGILETAENQLTIALAVTIPFLCIGTAVVITTICLMRITKKKKGVKVYW